VSLFFSKLLLRVSKFSKLLFLLFTDYFFNLLVDPKFFFHNYYFVSLFLSNLLLCGTLCIVVFTSMTIVSTADEDPRVVHGSVVLTESLLLWTWNCIQKFSLVVPSSYNLSCLVRASTSLLFPARTKSPATHCRKPLRVKRFTRSSKMLRMQVTPACTFASTAHAGCRVLHTT